MALILKSLPREPGLGRQALSSFLHRQLSHLTWLPGCIVYELNRSRVEGEQEIDVDTAEGVFHV